MFLSAGNGTTSHHRSSSLVPPIEGGGLLCPSLPNRRGSAPSGYQPPPPLAKPENTGTGFSLLSLVSSAASKNNKNNNGGYSDMYALHESRESQSEAEPEDETNTGPGGCFLDGDCDDNHPQECATEPTACINFNVENLKDMLKCVSCHRFLFPPILQCLSGHMECKNCFELKPQCGKCHQKMVEVPAKFAELIAEQFKVQCSYAERGCKECIVFKNRREHEEICPFKPVQCPEFDCTVTRPMNEIFKHFRLEHHHHFVNAHGPVFNGDIRCDDSNMIMGVERKWAPTMMKLDEEEKSSGSGTQAHFFLEILRTKHGVWHMWIWYLGEPDEAGQFRCEISIRKRARDDEAEIRYSGRVHSIRIPPHRIILSGCLLSFSDYTAAHFRYLGDGHQGHPVIDYRVSVSRSKRFLGGTQPNSRSSSQERPATKTAGLTKMLRRFSIDSGGANKANKPNLGNVDDNI